MFDFFSAKDKKKKTEKIIFSSANTAERFIRKNIFIEKFDEGTDDGNISEDALGVYDSTNTSHAERIHQK